jgi:hypothetical protein
MAGPKVFCAHGHPVSPGTKLCPKCGSDIEKYGMTASARTAEKSGGWTRSREDSSPMSFRLGLAVAIGAVVLLLVIWGATSSGGGGSSAQEAVGHASSATQPNNIGSAPQPNTDSYSVAYKLAVVDGDPGEEDEFQAAIDCIMATGIRGAETEEKVGDTLVSSWQQSGQRDSLLEWAQVLCSG